jgi:DNA-binding XRE family transcriptional regulator
MPVIAKITPALCRAARGLLDMTQIELAAGASVSKNTIVDFEKGRSTPVKNNLAAIQRVLEEGRRRVHQWRRAGPAIAEEEAVAFLAAASLRRRRRPIAAAR